MPHKFPPKPKDCIGCPLETLGEGFIQPEGVGSIPMLIVGESPGYNEIIDSLPFRPNAQAGSILHRVIQEKAKGNRSSLAFWNMIGCRPPGDHLLKTSFEYEAINHCRVYFDKVVKRYNPKVIFATGALPFKHLTGLQGEKLGIKNVRGYVFRSSRYPEVLVVPSFHPSFIRRGNSSLMGTLLWDFMKAQNIALGKDVKFSLDPIYEKGVRDYKYIGCKIDGVITNHEWLLSEAIKLLNQVRLNKELLISYDLETEKSIGAEEDELEDFGKVITQIQFSISKDSGIAFPWEEPFISIAKSILRTSNPKVGHNVWDFDNPILRKAGVEINGRIDDTMLMFHHWQADLPLGLQFVSSFYNFPFPWKHYAGKNLAFYGIADVDSVQYIMSSLPEQLKSRGLWGEYNTEKDIYTGYEGLVRGLKPILVTVEERGLPINKEKQDSFRGEIEVRQEEIGKELSTIVPEEFVRFEPKNGYVRIPKEITSIYQKLMVQNNTIEVNEDDIEVEALKIGLTKEVFQVEDQGIPTLRWCRKIQFNPSSADQVSDYIKYNGHGALAKKLAVRIAKEERKKEELIEAGEKKGKDNVSTSKGVLKVLANKTGNIAYSRIIESRELVKMAGTFLWIPSKEDGRVHTHFGFRTGSGQLTSSRYNIQQGPEHYGLAEKFKETIEAGEGKVLLKVDYKAYHSKMLGFLAEDKDFVRLSEIDPHSYVTAHMVGLEEASICNEWDDIRLEEYLKKVKKDYQKIRDDQAKHANLGIGFGLSEKGCYDRYREDFNPGQEEVIKGWGSRKKNKPEDINPKTDISYLQEEIERLGKKKVKDLYNLLRKLFPKIFKYQETILANGGLKGYIDTPFGHRRWFPAASEPYYDRFGNVDGVKKGEQAEEVLAYPVSNNAHCHLREGVILAYREGILDRLGMVNWVHDDLRFESNQENFMEDLVKLLKILERESKILTSGLGRFSCSADVKVGKNLRVLEEIKL